VTILYVGMCGVDRTFHLWSGSKRINYLTFKQINKARTRTHYIIFEKLYEIQWKSLVIFQNYILLNN